ncbi:MAG: hypothetical protein ACI81R_003605 [Bradymonadia bacterium]|jgi:hypothetical protein
MNALANSIASSMNAPATEATVRGTVRGTANTATLTLVEFPHAPANPLISTYSPACQKVHYAMNFAGLGFMSDFQENPAAWGAENPAKQFPFLRVNGAALPDSTAILRCVVEQAEHAAIDGPTEQDTPFYLADSAKRAEAWLWEEYAGHVLYGYVLASRWACNENFSRVCSHLFGEMPAVPYMIVPKLVRRATLKRLIQQDVTRAGLDDVGRKMRSMLAPLNQASGCRPRPPRRTSV